MRKFTKLFFALVSSSIFLISCNNDDAPANEAPRGDYQGGLFVVNEGNFGNSNGMVSYLSDENTIENNVFSLVNPGMTLGDTPQSVNFNGDLAYIVVNASNKIEIVNRYTFKSIATISSGLSNPRYIAFANGKAYVTNWGDGSSATDDYVAVVNLTTNTVTSSIQVLEGPEKMIENNGKVYVAHKGGWGQGNSISVINSDTNTVETNFEVGDVPSSLVKHNGTLYVLCNGRPDYAAPETAGKLVKVNLSNNTIASSIDFPGLTHPSNMDIDNDKIYYNVGAGVYTTTLNATTLPTNVAFSTSAQGVASAYGFAVKNNTVYVADAGNYADPGKVYVYSATGTVLHQYTVGTSPNGFYFNN
ncbi:MULTISPECIES: YncE family protein [Flavobacterium]|uniref:YncE family protein n=1 Tax=Flavobacterium TaxID=237 RepID=UPI001FCCB678|nr:MULTISPECIES: DUF5074 domain-containing protein [Flavobacterium]UOK42424.1 hypothetical protein LZF87_14085 [Flavobacterium enshiense]